MYAVHGEFYMVGCVPCVLYVASGTYKDVSWLRCQSQWVLQAHSESFCGQKATVTNYDSVQWEFRPPFFSLLDSAWATDQPVKIFSILVKILCSYSNFIINELCFRRFVIASPGLPMGRILRGDWLARVSYPREIVSPGFHTPGRLIAQVS